MWENYCRLTNRPGLMTMYRAGGGNSALAREEVIDAHASAVRPSPSVPYLKLDSIFPCAVKAFSSPVKKRALPPLFSLSDLAGTQTPPTHQGEYHTDCSHYLCLPSQHPSSCLCGV
jgi:hypothetical protein